MRAGEGERPWTGVPVSEIRTRTFLGAVVTACSSSKRKAVSTGAHEFQLSAS